MIIKLLKWYLNNIKRIQSFLLATVWFMWSMQSNIFLTWSNIRTVLFSSLCILERDFRSGYLSCLVNIITVHFWTEIGAESQLRCLEENTIILSRLWNLLLPFNEGLHFWYHCFLEALDPKNNSLKWLCKWKGPKCLNPIFNIYCLNKLAYGKIEYLLCRNVYPKIL